jgi:hypothetical protein
MTLLINNRSYHQISPDANWKKISYSKKYETFVQSGIANSVATLEFGAQVSYLKYLATDIKPL